MQSVNECVRRRETRGVRRDRKARKLDFMGAILANQGKDASFVRSFPRSASLGRETFHHVPLLVCEIEGRGGTRWNASLPKSIATFNSTRSVRSSTRARLLQKVNGAPCL